MASDFKRGEHELHLNLPTANLSGQFLTPRICGDNSQASFFDWSFTLADVE